MAVTDSDTTIGEVINKVGTSLDGVTADADRWGDATREALATTPGEAAPQPADPEVTLPTAPSGSAFVKPTPEPVKPNTTFDDPREPSTYSPSDIDQFRKEYAPSWAVNFNDVYTTYEPGGKPTLPVYTAPVVTVPDLDPAPTITAPVDVALSVVTPPTFGGLTLPSVAISINPAALPALTNAFDYTDTPFTPDVLNDVKAEVRRVLGGEPMIPAWIWDGVWSRAAGNFKRQEAAALREARYEHASRMGPLGLLPGVVMLSREEAARQAANESMAELSRENATKQAEMFREDLWKAVESGMAIETLLERVHTSARDRTLRAAIESNNAGIAVYQAAVQAYQVTEIAAKELLIKVKDLELRGSLAELEVFDAELKAAGFLLEYDKNQVELYKAQWSGEDTKAKAYAAYADAIKAYVLSQQAAVDAFGTQVQSNNTILQGWAIEWDAYLKRLKPAELRIQAHEARSSHFGRLVQEFQAKAQQEGMRVESDIKIEDLSLRGAQQDIEVFKALWAGIQTKMQALTSVYGTEGQVYGVKNQAESARVNAINQRYGLDLEKAKLELGARVSGMQNRLGYWDRWMQTWVQWNSASASAYAQLGGSAYSAMHYSLQGSATVGYDSSDRNSWSEDHNYNYDMTGA